MRRNDYKGIYLFMVLAVVLLLSGCASTSTFNAYTSQINPLIQNVKNNKLLDLKKELANKVNSADKILYLMERGRLAAGLSVADWTEVVSKSMDMACTALKK